MLTSDGKSSFASFNYPDFPFSISDQQIIGFNQGDRRRMLNIDIIQETLLYRIDGIQLLLLCMVIYNHAQRGFHTHAVLQGRI